MIDISEIRSRSERYRLEWMRERDKRDRMLASAVRDKTVLPDHYWQAEHRAHALYRSSLLLLEALEEA